jgi:hypothetical protein
MSVAWSRWRLAQVAAPLEELRVVAGASLAEEGDRPILVYRVADLDAALVELAAHGWERQHTVEIPQGPCCSLRTPGGHRIALYQLTRPEVAAHFDGRRDFWRPVSMARCPILKPRRHRGTAAVGMGPVAGTVRLPPPGLDHGPEAVPMSCVGGWSRLGSGIVDAEQSLARALRLRPELGVWTTLADRAPAWTSWSSAATDGAPLVAR